MKKALLRRKRRKPERMKKKIVPAAMFSRKEPEKRGKYTRSKIKQEEATILRDEV